MHIHRKFCFLFFLGFRPFFNFEIWRKWKILLKQLVSATPLKPLNRIAWKFVIMKDIMCRYAFLQEVLIWSFWRAIYIPFFLRLPVNNAWNCHSYSILKQCWSMGYVSLLTLSFILSVFVCKLLTFFASSPELLGQFQPNLASLDDRNSNCGPCPFPKWDDSQIVKTDWQLLDILFSRATGPISTKLSTKSPWV